MIKLLDTNFVCSFFNDLDSNHQKAKRIFFDISEADEIKVPFVAAAEVAVDEDSARYLPMVRSLTTKYLMNNESDIEFISKLPRAIRKKLKANDCLILALKHRYNAELVSFDKALLKIDKLLLARTVK